MTPKDRMLSARDSLKGYVVWFLRRGWEEGAAGSAPYPELGDGYTNLYALNSENSTSKKRGGCLVYCMFI